MHRRETRIHDRGNPIAVESQATASSASGPAAVAGSTGPEKSSNTAHRAAANATNTSPNLINHPVEPSLALATLREDMDQTEHDRKQERLCEDGEELFGRV
jgi:hypothetical protein